MMKLKVSDKISNIVLVFLEFSGREENSELNWEETQEILANLRENLKSTSDKSKNYSSYQKFYDDMYKHKRKEISPNDTFKSPVTYGQNYGFYKFRERDLNDIRYPKVKCEETKYAESIIMTGKQFMK